MSPATAPTMTHESGGSIVELGRAHGEPDEAFDLPVVECDPPPCLSERAVRVGRIPALRYQYGQDHQGPAADAVLAVAEHLGSVRQPRQRPVDPLPQSIDGQRMAVGRGQMQQLDSKRRERLPVIASLLSNVDHVGDSHLLQPGIGGDRDMAAHQELLVDASHVERVSAEGCRPLHYPRQRAQELLAHPPEDPGQVMHLAQK